MLGARRALFTSDAARDAIALDTGLPSLANPSDHVPVAALFAWTAPLTTKAVGATSLPNLRAVPVPQGGEGRGGGGGGGGGDGSVENP